MSHSSRQTFEQILRAAVSGNIQALEYKAHTACSLAVTYPKNEAVFHILENEALQKIFQILISESMIEDVSVAVGSGIRGRLAAVRLSGD
jgi:hypothetical protein